MDRIPRHVSIIMDGNGRWAEARGHERAFGHKEGVESVRAITEACVVYGVRYLSLYAFSEENWGRPEDEVGSIMKLMAKAISEELETMMKNGVRFLVRGNRARLDPALDEAISALEAQTASNDALTMVVLMSYSGRWDILQAAKRMAAELSPEQVRELDMDGFSRFLVTADIPDPDLIIRTSGEQRMSNYLLWQGAYSEFYFTDVLWPDFRKEEFRSALEEYSRRDRRFGKVK